MGETIQQAARGFKQELQTGQARVEAEKRVFQKKLEDTLGEEMKDYLEHPEKMQENVKFAKKQQKKKRFGQFKANLRKIFTGKEE